MIKLITMISAMITPTSFIAPAIFETQNINQINKNKEIIQKKFELNIDNKKFIDSNGNFIAGIKDYTNEFSSFVKEIKEEVASNDAGNLIIKSSQGKFNGLSEAGKIELSNTAMGKILNAKTWKIENATVDVEFSSNVTEKVYKYSIIFTAIADNESIVGNLYSYIPSLELTKYQILSGYKISFETEYQKEGSVVPVPQTFYWNSNHTKEIKTAYDIIGTTKDKPKLNSMLTLNLGKQKPNYKYFNFVEAGRNVEWRWDKTRGHWDWPKNLHLAFESYNNVKINSVNEENFDKYTSTTIVDKEVSETLAKCWVQTWIGYTWYEEKGNYYLQFLLEQAVITSNSRSDAFLSADIGVGVRLE
ncbi:hypothetical protein ESOMN_v1c05810 [Williamsoniiplasma somnilux]|uniref:Uncharacterized protein n=1 Tax=Williamsoniiplasma somnilux TaxID=215578 RepID=A0A2K8P240_9MOLU|nr:hypothetical protein [Williamsoniiplasma somnilux]ATZ18963.1 hypothetical protein ESOMN_v1c05810 [Williamsoniiplasma somnilux]